MQVHQLAVAAAWLAPTPEAATDLLPRHTLALALSKLLLFAKHHSATPYSFHTWWCAQFGEVGQARWEHVESFLQGIAGGRDAHALADNIYVRCNI